MGKASPAVSGKFIIVGKASGTRGIYCRASRDLAPTDKWYMLGLATWVGGIPKYAICWKIWLWNFMLFDGKTIYINGCMIFGIWYTISWYCDIAILWYYDIWYMIYDMHICICMYIYTHMCRDVGGLSYYILLCLFAGEPLHGACPCHACVDISRSLWWFMATPPLGKHHTCPLAGQVPTE